MSDDKNETSELSIDEVCEIIKGIENKEVEGNFLLFINRNPKMEEGKKLGVLSCSRRYEMHINKCKNSLEIELAFLKSTVEEIEEALGALKGKGLLTALQIAIRNDAEKMEVEA